MIQKYGEELKWLFKKRNGILVRMHDVLQAAVVSSFHHNIVPNSECSRTLIFVPQEKNIVRHVTTDLQIPDPVHSYPGKKPCSDIAISKARILSSGRNLFRSYEDISIILSSVHALTSSSPSLFAASMVVQGGSLRIDF